MLWFVYNSLFNSETGSVMYTYLGGGVSWCMSPMLCFVCLLLLYVGCMIVLRFCNWFDLILNFILRLFVCVVCLGIVKLVCRTSVFTFDVLSSVVIFF